MSFFSRVRNTRKSSHRRRKNTTLRLENMEPRLMFTLPAVTAQAAIVTTGDGEVLGELNADERRHMASTTKIMTALVAIEESAPGNSHGLSLDGTVDVGFYPANLNITGEGSGDGFDVGDDASLQDMLFATMLQSDNEAAQAVAEHIAIHQPDASLDEVSHNVFAGWSLMADFAELMNAKAEQLGMENSSFRTPDGAQYLGESLPGHGGHYSSARDLARLARYAMSNDTFYDLVGTRSVTISVSGDDRDLGNGNQLLRDGEGFGYPGAEGVKTGSTPVAGKCLVSQATLLGRTINAVVLGSTSTSARYEDTHALLNHGFQEAYGFDVDVDAWQVRTQIALYDVDDAVLTIEGTNNADVISIDFDSGKLRVELNGVEEEFPFSDLDRVEVKLNGGHDQVTVIGDIAPFDLSIEGGTGTDTLTVASPLILGAITGDKDGEIIEAYNGNTVVTFSQIEQVNPDDYADTPAAANKLSLMRGCPCNVDISRHGFMGSVDDQDWFRFDAGTGTITMNLTSLGVTESDATLQLWNVGDIGSPVLVDAVSADASKSVHVDAGSFAFKVGAGNQLSEYQLTASVPSSSLTARDMIGIPQRPEDLWPGSPKLELDLGGRGPSPDPDPLTQPIGKEVLPVGRDVQQPVERTIAQPVSFKVARGIRRAAKEQASRERTTQLAALSPTLVDAAIKDALAIDPRTDRARGDAR